MKLSKKLLSLLLCTIMLFGFVAIGGDGFIEMLDLLSTKASAYSTGDYIYYGTYPQSKVTDSALVSALNGAGGSWKSYGYYSGTGDPVDGRMKPSDYMRYKDVSYNGSKYRAVTFDSYRPYRTEYTSSSNEQQSNGYYTGNVYWFKYEPIKWRVLDPSTGLIMCDTAIDSQAYNNYIWYGVGSLSSSSECYGDEAHTYYASNYAKSSIRAWLNKDFYDTAFSSEQKSSIIATTLDNSSTRSSAYDAPSTTDKIFLLSYSDSINSNYGFSSSDSAYDTARQLKSTDYAKCQGCYQETSDSYRGNCWWWLRSPYHSTGARVVNGGGSSLSNYDVSSTSGGVVPALRLSNLKSDYAGSEIGADDDTSKTVSGENESESIAGNTENNTVICSDGSKQKFNKSFETILKSSPSSTYNPELADLLMSFSSSSYSKEKVKKSLLNFEFDPNSIFQSQNYDLEYECSVAFSIATKPMQNGDLLVFIPIRGSKGEDEWISDFDVSTDQDNLHSGFSFAMKDILTSLEKYFNGSVPKENVKYVLTGHSRGAAASNLLAWKLIQCGISQDKIYSYNFACPDTVYAKNYNKQKLNSYSCIFNISNANDIVSYVPGILCSVAATWDKFGSSYWFKENGNSTKVDMGFSAHKNMRYVTYLSNQKPLNNYFSLDQVKDWMKKDKSVWESVKGWLFVGVYCPVSVEITDENNNVVATVIDGEMYGTTAKEDILIITDGDEKKLLFPNNGKYKIRLVGTDTGKMDYSVQYYELFSDGIQKEFKYSNVILEKDKLFEDIVGTETMQSQLLVLDENNKPIYEVTSDGTEIEYVGSESFVKDYIVYIILGVLALIMIVILVIFLIKRSRRPSANNNAIKPMTSTSNLTCQLIPNGTYGICQKCKAETDNIFTFKTKKNGVEHNVLVCEKCGKVLKEIIKKSNR